MIGLSSCGQTGPSTTSTKSIEFKTIEEKVEFLEKYVAFDRSYYSLDFDIFYRNGGNGLLPSPSEWDIKIVAVVPKDELEHWTAGLSPVQPFDIDWIKNIVAPINYTGFSQWYRKGGIEVVVDEQNSVIVYRNLVM